MSDVFINPYTFIPVNNGKKQEYSSRFDGELLSGKISCTLRTKSQIAVCDDANEPGTKEFFSVDGKTPVIPGSEIRGVIRSIYEALTDSCLSSVNAENDDYFSSRMNKDKPGLLLKQNGHYYLYKAKRYADNKKLIKETDKTGDEVNFEQYVKKDKRGNGLLYIKCIGNEARCDKKGYIHKVDSFSNGKNHNSVFEKIEGREPISISEKAIERLEINLERYEPKLDGIKADYDNAFKRMKNEEGVYLPIWYVSENNRYYFAPSQMSRSIYFKRPIDLLREQDLHKCVSKSEICEACSVFGIVNSNGDGFAVPSRLRFSDAVFDINSRKDDPLDKIYRLPVLAPPRISSFEFYLSNRNMSFGADDEGTRIAGRKYYWHNNKKRITSDSTVGKDNMVSRVRLLKEGTEFKFEIFFDRITENMLRKLVFAVNLGENDINGKQCHKLGYGKPIGLGSVKIIADKITVRGFSDGNYSETDMTSIAYDAGNSGLFDNNDNNVQNVLRVTDFNAVDGALISYPCTNKSTDIFEWFSKNRDSFGPGKPSYKQKLPKPLAGQQTLKTYIPKPKKNSGNNRSGYHR